MATGTVIIGRNEGARLIRCLESIPASARPMVYVDSGSTDGSVEAARAHGAIVHALDLAQPFNAARARDEGFGVLRAAVPDLEYVQFVDGDCELREGWVDAALSFLESRPNVAVVCGRRRERFPKTSLFNALCDREWDTPVGATHACGGDSIMRASAYAAVGGFDRSLVAHEEPELSRRLRRAGWKLWRLDQEMTLHDAAITRLGQVWKRSRRAGFGYAQVLAKSPDWRGAEARMLARAAAWGIVLPLTTLVAAIAWPWAILVGLGLYLLQYARGVVRAWGLPLRLRLAEPALLMMTKFAEALGAIEFACKKLMGRRMDPILYKTS